MRIRYGWELALAALLVMEIVAFGAINPRVLIHVKYEKNREDIGLFGIWRD
ncbi:TPA: hypothetical protein ACG5RU_000245 [Escherichia coli]